MEIIWQAEDGYVGGRPQKLKFDLNAWDDDQIDASDIMEAVYEAVQEDFSQKVSWSIRNEGEIRAHIDEFIAQRKGD